MNLDEAVVTFAGCVVLLGILLSMTVHPWWIALTILAALNMIQAAFTGFCPAAIVFRKLGVRPGIMFK